jgi:hypothetical protein
MIKLEPAIDYDQGINGITGMKFWYTISRNRWLDFGQFIS